MDTHTNREAEELSAALHRAGVVLRHQQLVFLRPKEIAELVMQVLPVDQESAAAKLRRIEEELQQLESVHAELDRQATRTTHCWLWAGYILLSLQLVAFVWLTWWELSWDVMEPFGYIISLFYTLVGYTYFLAKGRVFDLEPFKEYWHSHYKRKQVTARKFDEQRYQHLVQLRERYQRYLTRAALRR
ncbi:hypothetical protein GPECTOR_60g743 [Gonium pectorale]|uniref:Calcium uniporter protein C-terminal domain-containing protein n=1 Tax=Gonium pectorale TaxID=33097 RepID=A0A150G602_GONPE|nr:hypothetical protein GPECTOR_60g743 [Gonium pectorale]|eukprot:KXZ44965.1 hypothetical protein GPECTOR_60g743 [Gonium pectorale]